MGKHKRKCNRDDKVESVGLKSRKKARNESVSRDATVAIQDFQTEEEGSWDTLSQFNMNVNTAVTRAKAYQLGLKDYVCRNNNATLKRSRPSSESKISKGVLKGINDNPCVVGNSDEELDYIDNIAVTVSDPDAEDGSEFPYEEPEEGAYESEDDLDLGADGSQAEESLGNSSMVDSEITFNKRPTTVNTGNFNSLRGDPAFEKFIKKCVASELRQVNKKNASRPAAEPRPSMNRVSSLPPPVVKSVVQRPATATVTAATASSAVPGGNKSGLKDNQLIKLPAVQQVKSPSDTTLYAPALNRTTANSTRNLVNQFLSPQNQIGNCTVAVDNVITHKDNNTVNQEGVTSLFERDISKFIEGVRIQADLNDPEFLNIAGAKEVNVSQGVAVPGTSRDDVGRSDEYTVNVNTAKDRANQMVLDAERYKATVNNPPGTCTQLNVNQLIEDRGSSFVNSRDMQIMDDDVFFHVSCHLDESLKAKIIKGEFVELERLLPKQRGWGTSSMDNGDKMDLIFKDGKTYFAPSAPQNKITGVRRWEQAFRIYAAVYSQANPARASEIWQYVHVINLASATYIWENVSYYDVTFRHLMHQNPGRSWAKIYNQMWNLAMREHLPRNQQSHNFLSPSYGNGGGNSGRRDNNQSNKKRKPKYCWAFNRGNCKEGAKCKYIDRCSVCDEAGHGKNTCVKKGN